ncbi:G patch domain and ankyrin repeat-containing protein 1 homolog [Sitodiplosis mosellana]|uniref:G patch domain and ankyrin repeat-containing protein 1 homolog n=1 Tax=Sitodiplosis mosellana TaxID=263140 RepID=UPI002444EBDE|nr:G patch domain and ankyrin repeat-containing protein 1 homolog [Sitodiplosis mosellana]
MHRFVRERGEETVVEKQRKDRIAIENGSGARETYENVLQMPSTSKTTRESASKDRIRRRVKRESLAFDKNQLFLAATSNDVSTIERMTLNNRTVNVTDQFGWTALMMAACDGHLATVKVLFNRGAKIDIVNKQLETALDLAEKKNHQSVVNFLNGTQCETICLSSDDEEATIGDAITPKGVENASGARKTMESFFCDICQAEFSQTDRKSHAASTLHRFNRTDSQKPPRHFGIPETNVGFQMLLQQGWDRKSGLGAERDGVIYPIKTTLRKPRSGLGTQQPNKPKVTHFKPFDSDAIKPTKPPSNRTVSTKRQMRAQEMKDKRKDRRLRKLLS